MASGSPLRRLLYYPTVVLLSAVAAFLLAEAYLGFQAPGRLILPFQQQAASLRHVSPPREPGVCDRATRMRCRATRAAIYHYTNERRVSGAPPTATRCRKRNRPGNFALPSSVLRPSSWEVPTKQPCPARCERCCGNAIPIATSKSSTPRSSPRFRGNRSRISSLPWSTTTPTSSFSTTASMTSGCR